MSANNIDGKLIKDEAIQKLWELIGQLVSQSQVNVSVERSLTSGTKIATITIGSQTVDLYCQTNTDTTYSEFSGATSGANGGAGLVPAPLKGSESKFLKGDGTWSDPPTPQNSVMVGANGSTAGQSGLVPQPPAGSQFWLLAGDGSFKDISDVITDEDLESLAQILGTDILDPYVDYSDAVNEYQNVFGELR